MDMCLSTVLPCNVLIPFHKIPFHKSDRREVLLHKWWQIDLFGRLARKPGVILEVRINCLCISSSYLPF